MKALRQVRLHLPMIWIKCLGDGTTRRFSVHYLYTFLNFKRVQVISPLIWWTLSIPPKIQIFMWLLFRNRILTKVNLQKRGCDGDTCVFCDDQKTANHLFLNCHLVKQIIYWLSKVQLHYNCWTSLQHVIEFALTLPVITRTTFLLVFSATCWIVWKYKNEVYFQNLRPKTTRNLIFLIISLVLYWTGSKNTKARVKATTQEWIPAEEIMDAIPLRVILPGEEESIPFQLIEESSSQENL